MFLGTVLFLATFLQTGDCSAAEASFEKTGERLLVRTSRWALALDARSGAIREIEDRTASGTLLRSDADLWVIKRHELPEVKASASRFEHQWNAEQGQLTLRFDGPEVAVDVVCTAGIEGPAWQATVRMKRGTMVGWRFPNVVEFDVADLHEFILPENLGLALKRPFFKPYGAGVERHSLGPQGLRQVTTDSCRMRTTRDEPVAVKPGKDAAGWLPKWYLDEMPRWRVTANRCPAGERHDLSLVETEHGSWLSAYRLGGWGWLFRFGGILGNTDRRPQVASVIATLTRMYHRPTDDGVEVAVPEPLAHKAPVAWPKPPTCIGIVLPRPTARPGTRLRPDPTHLIAELARQRWVKEAGIQIVVLRDAEQVGAALADPRRWFAMVNLGREGFPAASADRAEAMLGAIRDYVRQGGIWWEAGGGYPFYHAVVPRRDVRFRTANRDFCDFAAVDSKAGRWTLFTVQKPDDIYTPARAEIASTGPADARRGRYTHTLLAYAQSNDTVRLPLQQMVLGKPHREALRQYAHRNGFRHGLAEKASAEIVEKLKRCILLKVTTNDLKKSARIAEELPAPVLFHISDYLRGGFDKQYPDHLPPRPEVGTPEDLTTLLHACRRNGHLFMPYTNPTWWCVNPKGPTFEKIGDAPLSRNFQGETYPESYGLSTTQGYTICAWHPAVRAANDVIREQFTRQYPVDVLFQDQVGARGPRWDTNPASPQPGAYLEGIHCIARADAKVVPLGTEDGHDRLINYETMFCGLSAPWLPNRPSCARVLYEDLWPRRAWRIEPLALLLAHDKVLFYHHDLGGFVRNRRDLSITLALGYGLSWWLHTTNPSPQDRDWLERLCRVQAAVGPRCAGRALTEFEYLAPEVIRSRWDDLEIIANLTTEPWPVDAQTIIAPEGFLARSPDLEAGVFVRHGGKDLGPGGAWRIRDKQGDAWSQWSTETESDR